MVQEEVVYNPVQNDPDSASNSARFSRRSVLVVVGVLAIVGCIGVVAFKPNMGIAVTGENGFLGLSSDGANSCSIVTTQPGFNLATFISANWFIQQQMPIEYQTIDQLYCVEAQYTTLNPPKFWGQTIQVRNVARSVEGFEQDSEDLLCASQGSDASDPAKLQVGPCFLPRWEGVTSGPYWVLAYDEAAGYALISGGQPTIQMANGCRTGTGTNGSGLWIFTRQQMRNEALVQQVRNIAYQKGFDLSVLKDVDQTPQKCQVPFTPEGEMGLSSN